MGNKQTNKSTTSTEFKVNVPITRSTLKTYRIITFSELKGQWEKLKNKKTYQEVHNLFNEQPMWINFWHDDRDFYPYFKVREKIVTKEHEFKIIPSLISLMKDEREYGRKIANDENAKIGITQQQCDALEL